MVSDWKRVMPDSSSLRVTVSISSACMRTPFFNEIRFRRPERAALLSLMKDRSECGDVRNFRVKKECARLKLRIALCLPHVRTYCAIDYLARTA